MKAKKRYEWLAMGTLAVMLAAIGGCASSQANRTPEELLTLTASGLSAEERYGFSGISVINEGQDGRTKFTGVVQRHQGMKLYGAGGHAEGEWMMSEKSASPHLTRSYNPSWLMDYLLKQKKDVTLDAAKSSGSTAVLIIRANKADTDTMWRRRLQEQWNSTVPQSPQSSEVWSRLSSRQRQSFQQAWNREIAESSAQWRGMMSSLSTDSAYELTVDRGHLTPISLTERAQLHYLSGKHQKIEQRSTEFKFQLSK